MAGDPPDLETLYREVGPELWRYFRRRVANRQAAEELFQETFLAAAGNATSLAEARSRRAWLFGIGRRILLNHWRQAGTRNWATLESEPAAPAEEVANEHLEAMRRRIAALPEGQREAIELRLDADLSYAEIAETLGIPIGTVRSRLHIAVEALAEWAEEQRRKETGGAVRAAEPGGM